MQRRFVQNFMKSSLICGSGDSLIGRSGVICVRRLCWSLSSERLLSSHTCSDHLLLGLDHPWLLVVLHLLLGLGARLLVVLHLLLGLGARLLVVLHLLLGLDHPWLLVVGHLLLGLGTGLGLGHLIVLLLLDLSGGIVLRGVGGHAKFALPSLLPDAANDGDDDSYDDQGADDREDPPEPDQVCHGFAIVINAAFDVIIA